MALRLLLVDDDPDVLEVIHKILESFGHEVVGLSDSREAAEQVNLQKFDGAFVNAGMPHMNGMALTGAIRTSTSNASIPIFMLTGYNNIAMMRAGFRAGITFFLAKPIDAHQLSKLLECNRGAMLREKRAYARLPLNTTVWCRSGLREFTAKGINISQGGILLETSGGLEVGQQLELSFSLPQIAEVLSVTGQVVRSEPPDRIGIQFTAIDPEVSEAIEAYLVGVITD